MVVKLAQDRCMSMRICSWGRAEESGRRWINDDCRLLPQCKTQLDSDLRHPKIPELLQGSRPSVAPLPGDVVTVVTASHKVLMRC
jgi:hypothetical protein